MTTVRGKLVTLGGQQRFFPALSRNPMGACDAALERDDEDQGAHDAAMEHVADCSDEQAEELQGALDRRAGARARDRRARDGEMSDREREALHEQARDKDPDHRKDFQSLAAGGPDNPAVDSRRGMALDRRASAADLDVRELFGATAHGARNPT